MHSFLQSNLLNISYRKAETASLFLCQGHVQGWEGSVIYAGDESVAMDQYFIPFHCWVLPHCADVPGFAQLFTHWEMLGSFLIFLLLGMKYWYMQNNDTWIDIKDIMRNETRKLILKSHTLYDSFYSIFFKWQNYSDGEQVSGCKGREQMDGTIKA